MINTFLTIFSVATTFIGLLSFIAYMINTTKIIKGQEKEINQLKRALRNERAYNKEQLHIVPEEPEFGNF